MLVTELCPTLCGPVDCSLPSASVHGVLQARILEWLAIPFSRRSSQPRDPTQVSCIAGGFFTVWATREPGPITVSKGLVVPASLFTGTTRSGEGDGTHSSVLAWRILWTEEPGGLLSIGSPRGGHDWSDLACMHALEKEMATHSSILAWRIPGTEEPGGLPFTGLHRVGHYWSDLAAAAAAY